MQEDGEVEKYEGDMDPESLGRGEEVGVLDATCFSLRRRCFEQVGRAALVASGVFPPQRRLTTSSATLH
ncbi:hypothetical protein BZZ01_07895 [Nostocales cyanobacterium HT-58-2]|nr:hypothetical protein BZZ01_07895 [Nostocales cyanobacterium HT-58-2]